ncbi:hypothetical protein PybrP1_008399 [[Pythium] brassicae (nom. inval.)]|nr:hypothetical protein PybrP1_008399 [[Pythium] brassicae (nom. inval.)]
MPALRHFYKLRGHTRAPKGFVVPNDPQSDWPEKSRGLRIGAKVVTILSGGSIRQVSRSAKELKELKFPPLQLNVKEKIWSHRILPALEVYSEQFGEMEEVPLSFVAPLGDPWPKPSWGIAIGK